MPSGTFGVGVVTMPNTIALAFLPGVRPATLTAVGADSRRVEVVFLETADRQHRPRGRARLSSTARSRASSPLVSMRTISYG